MCTVYPVLSTTLLLRVYDTGMNVFRLFFVLCRGEETTQRCLELPINIVLISNSTRTFRLLLGMYCWQ